MRRAMRVTMESGIVKPDFLTALSHDADSRRSFMSVHRRFRSRVLLTLVGATAVLRAQFAFTDEPTLRPVRIGFVDPASPATRQHSVDAFWQHFRELGWVEGQNLVIETRWANGQNE